MPTSIRQSGIHTVTMYTPEAYPQVDNVFEKVVAYSRRDDAGILEVTPRMLLGSRAVAIATNQAGEFTGFSRLINHALRSGQASSVVEIGTLWVPPTGRGAGHDLIAAAADFAIARGEVPVAVANTQAHGKFVAAGFEELGVMQSGKTLMVRYPGNEALSAYEVNAEVLSLQKFAGATALELTA